MTPLGSSLYVKMSHKLRRLQTCHSKPPIIVTFSRSLSMPYAVFTRTRICTRIPPAPSATATTMTPVLYLAHPWVAPTKRCFLFLDPGPLSFRTNIGRWDTRNPSMRKSQLRSRMLGLGAPSTMQQYQEEYSHHYLAVYFGQELGQFVLYCLLSIRCSRCRNLHALYMEIMWLCSD